MAQYTDQQKQEAIDLYLQHGTAEAARRTGASPRSITNWARNAGVTDAQAVEQTNQARRHLAATNAERRERIRTLMLDKAEDLLGRMDEPHIDFKGSHVEQVTYPKATSGDVKNYAVAFAVLLDKYRLEMGETTSRAENVTIDQAVSVIDQEIANLAAQLGHADD